MLRVAAPYTTDNYIIGRFFIDGDGMSYKLGKFVILKGSDGRSYYHYFGYTLGEFYHGPFKTLEETKMSLDKLLLQFDFKLLDQEEFDKYKLLI